MKSPHAVLLMLTGLAGGIGGRLAFRAPVDKESRLGGRAGEMWAQQAAEAAAKAEKPGPRPAEASVLTAQGGSRLRLLMEWLPGAGEEELLRMAGALTGSDQEENLSIRLLMARWAELNPSAMVKWARTQTSDSSGNGFYLSNAIECWARVDFDKAWAVACADLPQARTAALLGLTIADPGKCLAMLRADPSLLDGFASRADPFGNSGSFAPMEKVMARLAARDPAATAALLEGGPASRLRRFAGDVALKWAKSDPAGAVAWMRGLDPGVRAASVEEAAKWIAGHAPEQLPALLDSLPAGRIRSMAAAEGFSRLASTDIAAARRQLEAMPPSPSRQFCRGLLMKELLHGGDEAGALALASQLGWHLPSESRPGTMQTVTSGASGFTQNRGDDGSNAVFRAFQDLMGRIASRDPQQAAALIVKSKANISELLTEENVSNHAALAAALLAQGDDNAAANCRSVVNLWAGSNPAAAAAWVSAHVPSGDDRTDMMSGVFTNWSEDPPAMLQWAATMDDATVRAAWVPLVNYNAEYTTAHLEEFAATADAGLYETLLSNTNWTDDASRILKMIPDDMDVDVQRPMVSWLEEKPEEATKWVRDLPPGLRRTNATETIVQHLNNEEDHEGAFAWAATMPDERRLGFLTDTVTLWGSEDADAAEAAIRASTLPPEVQQKLLDSLPPPK